MGGLAVVMSEQEQITYLANVIHIARSDGVLSPREIAAIEEVQSELGAKKRILNGAMKAAESETFALSQVGNFANQVGNVADMLYVSFLDGDMEDRELNSIKSFSAKIGLTAQQIDLMIRETIERAERAALSVTCPSCSKTTGGSGKFCPNCGTPLGKADTEPVKVALEIPASGYSIEFSESSASAFDGALTIAKTAPTFSTCVRGKKTWYLASWPEDSFT